MPEAAAYLSVIPKWRTVNLDVGKGNRAQGQCKLEAPGKGHPATWHVEMVAVRGGCREP